MENPMKGILTAVKNNNSEVSFDRYKENDEGVLSS
jgi:hypothetical protein